MPALCHLDSSHCSCHLNFAASTLIGVIDSQQSSFAFVFRFLEIRHFYSKLIRFPTARRLSCIRFLDVKFLLKIQAQEIDSNAGIMPRPVTSGSSPSRILLFVNDLCMPMGGGAWLHLFFTVAFL